MEQILRYVQRAGWMMGIILALGTLAHAQFGPEPAPRPGGADDSEAERTASSAKVAYQQNLEKYKGNADILVLPGLLASRKEKSVRLWCRATGLHPKDPLEFFIIPADSGKDYEALA